MLLRFPAPTSAARQHCISGRSEVQSRVYRLRIAVHHHVRLPRDDPGPHGLLRICRFGQRIPASLERAGDDQPDPKRWEIPAVPGGSDRSRRAGGRRHSLRCHLRGPGSGEHLRASLTEGCAQTLKAVPAKNVGFSASCFVCVKRLFQIPDARPRQSRFFGQYLFRTPTFKARLGQKMLSRS
jgi:hypothetical protein